MKQTWLFYFCPSKISYLRYWSFGEIFICKNQKLRIPIFMVYKAPEVQLTKIKYDSSAKEICHEIHANHFNPDLYLFFVIYVTVLCEPCFNADAVRSTLHVRLYAPVDFIHDIFTCIIFLCFPEFVKTKITLPCHLRNQKDSVQIQRGFKDISWVIMCCGVACVQTNTIKVRLSFLHLFLKQLPLVKLTWIPSHKWHRL